MRVCSCCGMLIFSGYVINAGQEYYCSSKCLSTKYTSDEWDEMYGDENYYTSWDSYSDDAEDYIEILPEEILRIFSNRQILEAIKKALNIIVDDAISKRAFIILVSHKLSNRD